MQISIIELINDLQKEVSQLIDITDIDIQISKRRIKKEFESFALYITIFHKENKPTNNFTVTFYNVLIEDNKIKISKEDIISTTVKEVIVTFNLRNTNALLHL